MKTLFLILIIASSVFAVEQYYCESSSFAINGQNENSYSAESQAFSINLTIPNVYSSESIAFNLTAIDEIPEPFSVYYLLFLIYYFRKFIH